MIRLYLADDHPIVAQGMAKLLGECRDIQVLGVGGSGVQALEDINRLQPDLVVLDVNLGDMQGAQVMEQVKLLPKPPKIIFYTALPESTFALELMNAGASGFLNKNARIEETLSAIRQVAAGKPYLSEDLKILSVELKDPKSRVGLESLSKREYEVLVLLILGKRQKEIQEALNLGHGTVTTYLARLHRKLGTSTLPDLVRAALRAGVTPS